MALKTRIILGLATLVALIVVWILPPRPCADIREEGNTALAVCGGYWGYNRDGHENSLRMARANLQFQARNLALADTLRHALTTENVVRSADGSVAVMYEEPLSADSARVWLNLAVAERDEIPGRGAGTRIVVALRSAGWRPLAEKMTLDWATRQGTSGTARFASIAGTDSTCFVVLRIEGHRRDGGEFSTGTEKHRTGSFLGQCALMARFGVPGSFVGRSVGSLYGEGNYYGNNRRSSVLPDLHDARRNTELLNGDYRMVACISGSLPNCGEAVGFKATGGANRRWDMSFSSARDLVAFLLVQDADRFGRFWRSPRPVPEAIAEGFGRPANEMVQVWARHRFVAQAGGPAASSGKLLSTLGWFGGAMIVAMAVGMRRRIGA